MFNSSLLLQDLEPDLSPVQRESKSFAPPNENPLPAGLLERKLDGHKGPECKPAPEDPFRDVSPGLSLHRLTLDCRMWSCAFQTLQMTRICRLLCSGLFRCSDRHLRIRPTHGLGHGLTCRGQQAWALVDLDDLFLPAAAASESRKWTAASTC